MDIIGADRDHVPTLSVVAPCFNEQEILPEFLRRVQKVCAPLGLPYEIVLVDDGSKDATWDIIAKAAAADARILGIRLRRNHGHQSALSAGLASSSGQLVLLIDADLQDPPELLPAMIETMRMHSADVVYGQRRQRAGESVFKRATATMFYRVLAWLSETPIPRDSGDFRLLSRSAVDLICDMPEQHRFLRGMIAWIGGRQVAMVYDRDPREAGSTKYPILRMMRFASDAITGFSRRPLQLAIGVGLSAGFCSLCIGIYSVVGWWSGRVVPGWASIMGAVAFASSLQFIMLGIIGEYLGRLYEESRSRPLFLEWERVGQGLASSRNQVLS
jgi:glycosyltransferase involved in cell wall biosynthesis